MGTTERQESQQRQESQAARMQKQERKISRGPVKVHFVETTAKARTHRHASNSMDYTVITGIR